MLCTEEKVKRDDDDRSVTLLEVNNAVTLLLIFNPEKYFLNIFQEPAEKLRIRSSLFDICCDKKKGRKTH